MNYDTPSFLSSCSTPSIPVASILVLHPLRGFSRPRSSLLSGLAVGFEQASYFYPYERKITLLPSGACVIWNALLC